MSKPRVLIFVDYYLPGFKAGGPIASVSRMVKQLFEEFDLWIFTRDRDLGDASAYDGIHSNQWQSLNDSKVYYGSAESLTARHIEQLVREVDPDVIYLNSYFSVLSRRVFQLRKLGRIRRAKIALAPRGEFSEGALALKRYKKRAYLSLDHSLGLSKGIVWHVSTEHEARDVIRFMGLHAKTIVEAPDLLDLHNSQAPAYIDKSAGSARFCWISRISPKKNLAWSIEILKELKGKVEFSIFGPIEDLSYWQGCQAAIEAMPGNIHVHYEGAIPPDAVCARLSESHFFLFPTLGENFGHVIPEALAAGCPVLLSDQTPWLDLERHHAGWVTSLHDRERWIQLLQLCIDMDDDEFQQMRNSTGQYLNNKRAAQKHAGNSRVFSEALSQ